MNATRHGDLNSAFMRTPKAADTLSACFNGPLFHGFGVVRTPSTHRFAGTCREIDTLSALLPERTDVMSVHAESNADILSENQVKASNGELHAHSRLRIPNAGVFAAVLCAWGLAAGPLHAAPPKEQPLWTEQPTAAALDPDGPVSMRAFADLARVLSPAVVNITTGRAVEGVEIPGFRRPEGTGLGSGFIIRTDGLVLTNHHVIKDASNIVVRLANDDEFPARVVGQFPPLDVALLKFEPDGPLAIAPLGDSRRLDIGEWVIAIGNPFGLNHTVTAGIVSAKGRRDVVPSREVNLARFIQTDASINPGNSGGPLINIRGEVVGINTAINPSGQGIGFAVPIDMVKTILPQLAVGKVSRSFLGVRFGAVPPEMVADMRKKAPTDGVGASRIQRGAWVREVVIGGPAARGGIQAGDIITEWNGQTLTDWDEVGWLASTAGSGKKVRVALLRGERKVELEVTLGDFPEENEARGPTPPTPGATEPEATARPVGLRVKALNVVVAKRLGLRVGEGVVVESVLARSLGAAVGIRAGDIITKINGVTLKGGVVGYQKLVDGVPSGGMLAFELRRGEAMMMKAFAR